MDKYKINERFSAVFSEYIENENAELERFEKLETDILEKGVLDPIKLWRNPEFGEMEIVDGYTRYSIIKKHEIKTYPVKVLEFENEDEAEYWIRLTQGARRNLSPRAMMLNIGRAYNLRKKKPGNPNHDNSGHFTNSIKAMELVKIEDLPKGHYDLLANKPLDKAEETKETVIEYDEDFKPKQSQKPENTAENVAKEFGVSKAKVERLGKIEEVTRDKPELKKAFTAGKVTQKEILTPKPPAPEPTKPESNQDIFTQVAAKHGRTIHTLLTDLQTAIVRANNEFAANGQDFDDFAKRLRQADLSLFILDARLLKTLSKCAKCKGEKCEKCKQTGYQNKSNYSTTKSALSV